MPRLTAKELRKRATWDVDIEDGFTVKVRRIDMVQAYMQNLVPLPLIAALDRLLTNSDQMRNDPAFFTQVPDADREATIEILRRYVCIAVIDPIFVMEDDGNPDHCPVEMLTSTQLMAIWASGPKVDAPEVRADNADRFRARPAVQAETAAAVPNGEEVPPAAIRMVDTPLIESSYL